MIDSPRAAGLLAITLGGIGVGLGGSASCVAGEEPGIDPGDLVVIRYVVDDLEGVSFTRAGNALRQHYDESGEVAMLRGRVAPERVARLHEALMKAGFDDIEASIWEPLYDYTCGYANGLRRIPRPGAQRADWLHERTSSITVQRRRHARTISIYGPEKTEWWMMRALFDAAIAEVRWEIDVSCSAPPGWDPSDRVPDLLSDPGEAR